MYTRVLSVLLALLHVTAAWMDAPYNSEDFNTRAEYISNVTLPCSDTRVSDSAVFQYWILPDLTVLYADGSLQFSTIDGQSTWQVGSEGQLEVSNLNQRQFGFYYCVVEDGSMMRVVKKAINWDGPYFGNLWANYRMRVITGLSAAAVFLVLAVVAVLLIYYFGAEPTDGAPEPSSYQLDGARSVSVSSDQGELGHYMDGLKQRNVSGQNGEFIELQGYHRYDQDEARV